MKHDKKKGGVVNNEKEIVEQQLLFFGSRRGTVGTSLPALPALSLGVLESQPGRPDGALLH